MMHSWSYAAIVRAERFVCFCIKNYIGSQDEDLPTHPVVYATDRSNAVALVLFSYYVTLCFNYEAFS